MADNVTITPTVQTITVTPAGGITTTITPAATQTVTITQSASISSAIDTTDALTEGSTNLYYTDARASAAAPVQTLTMPSGYTVTDVSGDLTVSVTNASNARAGIGADNAANLTTGDLAAARVSTIPINSFSDVSITKTADNIVYTDGANVRARAASNWNLTDFTNDLTSGDLPAHTHAASELTSGSLSIDLIPDTDQAYDLGSADYRWNDIHGDLDGPVIFRAKISGGGTLAVGDVVYIDGVNGEVPTVAKASASSASTMPAFGIISQGGSGSQDVHVTTLGSLTGIALATPTYAVGDTVYVSTTAGQFTTAPPTGESNLIQNIGYVAKTHASNGILKVGGAGRTNAVPNLNSGNIFYGNGSNQAVSTALSTVAEAAGAVSTHAALTSSVHGISSFGATLVDDADAATARTTLGVTNIGSYTGQIETAADKTYTIDPGAATARTITGFYIKSDSGTCTATLKVGANTVKAASVSSSSGDQTGLANTSVSTNDVITIVVTSNSSALDVIFSVEYSE